MQLEEGVPVHVVAARDDAAPLLRMYVKRTRKPNTNAGGVLDTIAEAITRTGIEQHGTNFGSKRHSVCGLFFLAKTV
jgi:hypothetical protein